VTCCTGEIIDCDLEAIKPTSTKYRLTGVVVHSGQASGGHYYSYILHRYAKLRSYNNYAAHE
jgi:ubiquitin carboxyl-terminal hydrolase 9/24